MSLNGISSLSTKALKQVAKLNYAQRKRQGYLVGSTAGSVLLNGTTQYLTSPTNAAFTCAGDFTVEGWYYPTNVTGGHSLFCLGTETTGRYVWALSGTSITSNLYGAGTTTYTSTVPINTWTHIAVVRAGSTVTVYINGVASVTTDTQAGTLGNNVLQVGADSGGAALFAGNISNFRVVKGTALYTTTFTTSNTMLVAVANTSLLLTTIYGSNFLVDASSNAFTMTNTGTATSSSFSPSTTNTSDTSATYYRALNKYDINLLPTRYSSNTVLDNTSGSLVSSRAWVSFLPTDLFAASEKGVWYDPSDITTLFQDAAGTIPVTASGQSVGLMLDKSGNGAHASQSTSGKRPTFYVYPNGMGSLNFDGVSQFLVTGNINLTGTAKVTATVGVEIASGVSSAGMVLEFGPTTLTTNGSFYITAPASSFDHSFGMRGTTVLIGLVSNLNPTNDILTGVFDISQSTKELELIPRLDGTTLSGASITWSNGPTAGTGTFGNRALYIGSRAGTSGFFNGHFYGAVVRGATSTSTQITNTETWATNKLS